jgi:hypothetical protein
MRFLLNFVIFCVLFFHANSQECGKQHLGTELILRGNTSVTGQWPWLAPFFQIKDDSSEEFVCGSSLISNLHVVTGELKH